MIVFVIIEPLSPTSKSMSNLYVSPAVEDRSFDQYISTHVSPREHNPSGKSRLESKLTFHVQLNFFPLQTAAIAGRASVLSLVAHVHFLYVQTSIPEHLESGIIQIVHSRVPVPLDGRFGITFRRAVQHHRVSLDRLRRILRLDGKLWRNWNESSNDRYR